MNIKFSNSPGPKGDSFIAAFDGDEVNQWTDSGSQPNIALAYGVLFYKNRAALWEINTNLPQLIEAAALMGVPGLTAFGEGLIHNLPWTKELLEGFRWDDFSKMEALGYILTGEHYFSRKRIEDLLNR